MKAEIQLNFEEAIDKDTHETRYLYHISWEVGRIFEK